MNREKLLLASLTLAASIVVTAALAQDREKIAAGAEVYATRCSACHGERMRATGVGFDLSKLTPDDRQRFDKAVNDGKGQMPPWAGVLSEEEIDQLWAYVRSRIDG